MAIVISDECDDILNSNEFDGFNDNEKKEIISRCQKIIQNSIDFKKSMISRITTKIRIKNTH